MLHTHARAQLIWWVGYYEKQHRRRPAQDFWRRPWLPLHGRVYCCFVKRQHMYERSVINREYVYVHYTFTSTRVESTYIFRISYPFDTPRDTPRDNLHEIRIKLLKVVKNKIYIYI